MPFYIYNKHAIAAGSSDSSWCDESINVMRPSVLGNPFPISRRPGGDDRDTVIEKFRKHLDARLESPDSAESKAVGELAQAHLNGKDIALICCCSPQPCHAQVISEAALRLAKEMEEKPRAPSPPLRPGRAGHFD